MKQTPEFIPLDEYPSWEINSRGEIRNVVTHEYKRISYDTKNRPIAVFYRESGSSKGYADCIYISDLLLDNFGIKEDGTIDEDSSKLKKIVERVSKVKQTHEDQKSSQKSRSRTVIVCEDTGAEFTGYTAAAKAFGFNYDKFYNAFYETKQDTIEFEGKTFTKKTR